MSAKKKPVTKKPAKKAPVKKVAKKGKKLGRRKPQKFPYVVYLTKELIAALKKEARKQGMFYTDYAEGVLSKALGRN